MRPRTIAWVLGLALVLVFLPATLAGAEFRGTDLWGNVAPGGSGGGLMDQYPLSHYALDYHVDGPSVGLGGASAGSTPELIAQFFCSWIFMGATWFMRMVISAFDWAFSADIVGGPHGVLAPVSKATQHLYGTTIVPLMATAFVLLGGWIITKMIGRKFGEVGAGVARTVCLVVAAMVIIFNPAATIGQALGLTNDLSSAIVSSSTGANGATSVSDQLFTVFVRQPWTVLEFAGFKVCTGQRKDKDGFPLSVPQTTQARAATTS